MSKIDQTKFLSEFQREGNYVDIDVKDLDASTLEKLKKAGVSLKDLEQVAGTDGKISGEKEFKDLYSKIDSFEKTKDPSYFDTVDNKNVPTTSGKAYDALKQEVDRNMNKARAQGVLSSSPNVSATTDPHAKHVKEVRENLKKAGLPNSAKGVTVMVIGDDPVHGAAVTRTIAGKATGLAQDADVRFKKSGDYNGTYVTNHKYTREFSGVSGDLKASDYAKLGIAQKEATIYAARQEIKDARKELSGDGKTRIANMSWGKSPARIAVDMSMGIPTNSKMFRDAVAKIEAKSNGARFDPNNNTHVLMVRREMALDIVKEMKTLETNKDNQDNFKKLKGALEKEVKDARKDGILVFNAAGNELAEAKVLGDEALSTLYSDQVKGLITVGAADLSKATSAGANAMWDGSAKGSSIEITAPGVNLPVGASGNTAVGMNGTSFASPYAASVAALMVAANPKITPDQIDQILTSGRVTVDLQGDRDGKGMLDPVKAVKEAQDLAKGSAKK